MTREEKMQWWNSLTLEEQYAHYEKQIQEVKNKLYIDGKIEYVRNYYGEYPVYKYNEGLTQDKIKVLEKYLRSLLFSRNSVGYKITAAKE